jgi:hypothetical protein
MKNRCAYCHGRFGLVRHRHALHSFCSRICLERHKAVRQADLQKCTGFFDYIWFLGSSSAHQADIQPRTRLLRLGASTAAR